jgi:hypothetical protein
MGIGPTYEIRIELATCAIGTRVTVSDRGAISEEEARSLREGWIDFVTRLENAISTGRVTRYQWSETINATALVGQDAARVIASLSEQPWWAARFPGAELSVSRIPGGVAAEFRDPAWRGTSTRAEIAIERHTGMAMLQLRHDGWARLPIEIRLAERRRFAARWADCLAQLEASAAS